MYDGGSFPEVYIIDKKENETIKIDEIRKLFEDALEKPIISNRKIYIIKNAEKLNVNAQNAILKILEEPPSYIHIFLISKNIDNILPTIKSRTKKIYIYDLEEQKKYEQNLQKEKKDIKANDDKNTLEVNNYDKFDNIFKDIGKLSQFSYYNKYKKLFTKENYKNEMTYLEEVYDNNLNKGKIYNIAKIYSVLLETKRKISNNCNYEMLIDNFLIKSWEIMRQNENS